MIIFNGEIQKCDYCDSNAVVINDKGKWCNEHHKKKDDHGMNQQSIVQQRKEQQSFVFHFEDANMGDHIDITINYEDDE